MNPIVLSPHKADIDVHLTAQLLIGGSEVHHADHDCKAMVSFNGCSGCSDLAFEAAAAMLSGTSSCALSHTATPAMILQTCAPEMHHAALKHSHETVC